VNQMLCELNASCS